MSTSINFGEVDQRFLRDTTPDWVPRVLWFMLFDRDPLPRVLGSSIVDILVTVGLEEMIRHGFDLSFAESSAITALSTVVAHEVAQVNTLTSPPFEYIVDKAWDFL